MKLTFIELLPNFIQKKLEGRDNLKKILGNTSWLFADRLLHLGIELFISVWIARYLGTEQFGIYSYVIAFVALFRAFASFGLDRIVVRDIVSSPKSKDEIISTAFFLKFLGGIFGLIVAVGTIIIVRPQDILMQYLVAIISASLIFQAFDVIDFWFQSQVRSKYIVIAKNIVFLLISFLKFFLIQVKAPLITFAWTILLEFILYAISLNIVYRINGYLIRFKQFCLVKAKKMLNDSLPLMLSSIAIMIYMKIDQIMLGEMTNSKEVGIYSAAVNLSEAWYFVPVAVANSVFPAIVRYRLIDTKLYYQKLQSLFCLMVAISYLVAIPCTFLAPSFIKILFGNEYQEAGIVLSVHIWSGLFVGLGVVRGLWIVSENANHFQLFSTFLGAVINIILNILLIPHFQAIGASIATIISYAVAAFFLGFLFKKTQYITYIMSKSIILSK